MCARRADQSLRTVLVETAARLIATEGPASLTLRRVARDSGTSTMAVYTYFGGMPELRRAVRQEGFARLAAHLAELDHSADPVADLAMVGLAYYRNATRHPNLYRVMFMEQPVDAEDAAAGDETFQTLIAGVERCIAAGRFDPADPIALATELWVSAHGAITLHLVECLSAQQALDCYLSTVAHLFTAYGDDPRAVQDALAHALRSGVLEAEPAHTEDGG